MREGKLEDQFGVRLFNVDFGNTDHRYNLVQNPEFVYGHYKIGIDIKWNGSPGTKSGYATVGGLRCGSKLFYSVALCSPQDNFSKKVGRRLVVEHFLQDSSNKRGVFNIIGLEHEQPALLLKKALEYYLSKTKHLPFWTRGKVCFRNNKKCDREIDSKVDTCYNSQNDIPTSITVIMPSLGKYNTTSRRHVAALKAWETRRKRK
jgi:hypothetical protein